ncbi:MAG: acetylglutamate kinase [Dehalococcoidia bacterium]|nr:acetylglutamate kinase [Dehalococcoidia bacterium]
MKPIIVKIGGSTLGSHDTTLDDLVALQREDKTLVVVHGGHNVVTEWLSRLGIATRFIDGLRVTDHQTLQVVIAVLCGLVNKELVAAIQSRGGRAMGLCGIDGHLIEARIKNEELGQTGEIVKINVEPIEILLKEGYIPIISPLGLEGEKAMPLNINGDTAAGEIAAALSAERLIILTDVAGVMDGLGKPLPRLSPCEASSLIASGVVMGGMIPKVEACLCALSTVPMTQIVDGRLPHALVDAIAGKGGGTIIA